MPIGEVHIVNIAMAPELTKKEMEEIAVEMRKLRKKRNRARRRRSSRIDYSFKYNKGKLPKEKRSSARLMGKSFNYTATPEISEFEEQAGTSGRNLRKRYVDNFDEDSCPPKKARYGGVRRTEVPFVAVDDITDEYIKNVASKISGKKHSAVGTSCHQCRQKTNDSKTYCRSGTCIGMRGQFCGICLANRYGESAAAALKDPNWCCPPCRNLCNCSICRARIGKRPTGVLAPITEDIGFRSVADFLEHLQKQEQIRAEARQTEEGDEEDEDDEDEEVEVEKVEEEEEEEEADPEDTASYKEDNQEEEEEDDKEDDEDDDEDYVQEDEGEEDDDDDYEEEDEEDEEVKTPDVMYDRIQLFH